MTTNTLIGQCDHCGQDLQMFDSVPQGMPTVFRHLVGFYIHTSGFFACNPSDDSSSVATFNGQEGVDIDASDVVELSVAEVIDLLSDNDPRIDSQWDEHEGL